MDSKYMSLLTHNYEFFTKKHITSTAEKYGLLKKESLEYHLWVYELYSHIQKRSGFSCILKGGACAQLYLPLEYQRCTADIDAATSLSPEELDELLRSIRHEFNMKKLYVSYSEYVPEIVKRHGKTIPMMTFMFDIPFILKGGKMKRVPSMKIDFLFSEVERIDKTIISKGETIGLNLNFSPICVSPYALICDKLLTFAKAPIGLDIYKIEGFYKNIYDMFYLIDTYNDVESFKLTCSRLNTSIEIEFMLKNLNPPNIDDLLEDILVNLYSVAVADLSNSYNELHRRVLKFQDSSIQEHIRKDLNFDSWSIMAMYLYIWTTTLKEYILKGDYSRLGLINDIITQYEYFLTLGTEDAKKYHMNLKNEIIKQSSLLNLRTVENPLRTIYLHNILFNF